MLERPPKAFGLEVLFGWPAVAVMALGELLYGAWWVVSRLALLPVRGAMALARRLSR